MKVEINGIVEDFRSGEYEGHPYQNLTILDMDGGKVKFSLGDNQVKADQLVRLMPVKVTATMTGAITDKGGFRLKAEKIVIAKS